MKIYLMIFVLAFFAFCSQNQDAAVREHPDSSGWADLFPRDLSDAMVADSAWIYKNDVLIAERDRVIWSQQSYDNFILDLEFKNAKGSNSGVIVYCSDINNWVPTSVEIQIADDYNEPWKDSPPTWQCGAIFGHLAPKKRMVKKAGEWNHYTITCKDQFIDIMLNGETVTKLNMSLYKNAEKNPDGSDIPNWLSTPLAELPTKGHIGLQGKHGHAPIYFRNIKIKEIE